MIYVIFAVLFPSMCYIDYKTYCKKIEAEVKKQPDYESNNENYNALIARLCAKQKNMEIIVCIVLVILAIVLAGMYNSIAAEI